MTRSLQAVTCRRPSVLESAAGGRRLGLETSHGATPSGVADHPRFFTGFLTSPQVASAALLAVADVAAARYYQRQLPSSLDPVVTANGDRLRFESFSGCGGVYARLDVLEPGLDGGEVGHGTTNVDVNNPLARGPVPDRHRRAVKPLRLAESARTAAATGANATIWGMLRHTLPALLADLATAEPGVPARGLGDLLAVAAECAERSGARGELPHLAQTAGRRGSSRPVAQARRLRSALVEGVAA
jgi:hypothetical protein